MMVVVDGNYLAWRAFHSTGHLSHDGQPTGIAFGFLREVFQLKLKFNPQWFVFCFDHGTPKRKEIYPQYKDRGPRTEEELEIRNSVYAQMNQLRYNILPELGYKNIFEQPGYEADDCIASITNTIIGKIIIVSADQDLYQLISPNVSIWQPRSKVMMDLETFTKEYSISPNQWIKVKSIAGCKSDNIDGVDGVGEITAVKYIRGLLKPDSNAYLNIERDLVKTTFNKRLVKLPYEEVNKFKVQDDDTSIEKWESVLKKLGMKSIKKLLRNQES